MSKRKPRQFPKEPGWDLATGGSGEPQLAFQIDVTGTRWAGRGVLVVCDAVLLVFQHRDSAVEPNLVSELLRRRFPGHGLFAVDDDGRRDVSRDYSWLSMDVWRVVSRCDLRERFFAGVPIKSSKRADTFRIVGDGQDVVFSANEFAQDLLMSLAKWWGLKP